jgi:cell fate regulator YaaT (PSP1 superfamily)
MFHFCEWMVYNANSIWSDTSEGWNERKEWKAVGTLPRRRMQKEQPVSGAEERSKLASFDLDRLVYSKFYYGIEFESGRLEIAYGHRPMKNSTYVIIEADRGEDCGRILGSITKDNLSRLLDRTDLFGVEAKKVIREATASDLQRLEERRLAELYSLQQCKEVINLRGIEMEILGCEYQWDMKKITFYFKSSKRVDFRNLLKDLFRMFKVRIWMCAENRMNSNLIKEILDY